MTEIKILDPIATLSDAVRVLKAASGKIEKAEQAEAEARVSVTTAKAAIRSALDEDRADEIATLNTKLRQANNAVDRAIERKSGIEDEYAQALAQADRAISAIKGGK